MTGILVHTVPQTDHTALSLLLGLAGPVSWCARRSVTF